MKKNKFGKIQRLLLGKIARSGKRVATTASLYEIAFPRREYGFSYLIPILLRMEYQGLVKVDWDKSLVKMKEGLKWRERDYQPLVKV